MPLISEFAGISIYMYNNGTEHNPPHFHAICGENECLIDIKKIRKIAGKMKRNKLRMILVWCELHQAELLKNWEYCQNKITLLKISPLA